MELPYGFFCGLIGGGRRGACVVAGGVVMRAAEQQGTTMARPGPEDEEAGAVREIAWMECDACGGAVAHEILLRKTSHVAMCCGEAMLHLLLRREEQAGGENEPGAEKQAG